MNNEYKLTICIPTFNRKESLKKVLDSIVCQKKFVCTSEVEIVISDNNSTDGTEIMVREYVGRFGNKIKYYKNRENIGDLNFYRVLNSGNGALLKLSNDTMIYKKGSLDMMVALIEKYEEKAPIMFFSNRNEECNYFLTKIDDIVKDVSYLSTWSGSVAVWKKDLNFTKILCKYYITRLGQVKLFYDLWESRRSVLIINRTFCSLTMPSRGGNYNISEVFIKNYGSILYEYVCFGYLSESIFYREMLKTLYRHVLPRELNFKHNFNYGKSNFFENTKLLHRDIRFYPCIILALMKKLFYIIIIKNKD